MMLEGALSIENAEATKRQLLDSLDGTKDACIDVSGVQSIDLAGMQLLIALEKECRARGIALCFCGKPQVAFLARLEDAGFIDKNGECDGPLDLAFRR
jgi:anti-anti-sigma factor